MHTAPAQSASLAHWPDVHVCVTHVMPGPHVLCGSQKAGGMQRPASHDHADGHCALAVQK